MSSAFHYVKGVDEPTVQTVAQMTSILDVFQVGMDRNIPAFLPFPPGRVLNIGAGNKVIHGAHVVDYPNYDADMDARLPYPDGFIAGIHAYHFLEHVQRPVEVLQEFQRVLQPGGVANIVVPYYNSQMNAQDLDHKSSFTETTWQVLFRNPYYNKNRITWELEVGANLIIGLVERNLCLCTQLIKRS